MGNNEIAVRVRFFAAVREALGKPELVLRLTNGTTAVQMLDQLEREHQQLHRYRPYLKVSVNHMIVSGDTPLHDGDEIALLPPVGGG